MGLKSYQDVREDTAITVDTAGASDISEKLLAWHHGRVRQFPWRDTRDPFAILLAEVMLQRTQAPQAARIFAEFISKYSSPIAVIHTEPEVVETLLSGLGLRHRARRVIELCKALIDRHGGIVPDDPMALAALPGVGPYTVAAVRCFAFGHDVPIVDRNVVRVLTRVVGYSPQSARPHTDRGLWNAAAALVPNGRSRDYNLALLDLAATVCTDDPKHLRCPLRDLCRYFQANQRDAART